MILTEKLSTREDSMCGLINDLDTTWCCGIVVRVGSVEIIFQVSQVGRVKAGPELLIMVISRELTFVHKRTSYREKFVAILIEIPSSVHVGLRRVTNKLTEMLLSDLMHLGVIQIQLQQLLFEC